VTRIGVRAAPGRARLALTSGPVSPRVLRTTGAGARIALVATTALLLSGDHVLIDIDVGDGAWLEIVEIAGTVAYDAAGEASSWTVRAHVGDGGALIFSGLPFIVSDGANTLRRTSIDLGADAVGYLRETLVLGRAGEIGGAVRSSLSVSKDGSQLLVEDLDLRDVQTRRLPGVLGDARVLDTVGIFGLRAPAAPALPPGHRFELDGPGTIARSLTARADQSPLEQVIRSWRSAAWEHHHAEAATPWAEPLGRHWPTPGTPVG